MTSAAIDSQYIAQVQPLLSKMKAELAQLEYRINAAIEAIVLSPQFRKILDQQFVGIE